MAQRRCETVMLVNDDPSFIDVLGDSLRAEGLAVLLVPGVSQAVTALRTGFRPDALLLDVLPRSELHDLLEVVQHDPELRGIPVVATSRDAERMVRIAPDGGADRLPLPATAHEFSLMLDDLCVRRGHDALRHTARRAGR